MPLRRGIMRHCHHHHHHSPAASLIVIGAMGAKKKKRAKAQAEAKTKAQKKTYPPVGVKAKVFLKSDYGHYITEDKSNHKKAKGTPQKDPIYSVWVETHIGNGYYIFMSHGGRYLSIDEGTIKLCKSSSPVKQKSMFYREEKGKRSLYRNPSGFFLEMSASATLFPSKQPNSNGCLFTLEVDSTNKDDKTSKKKEITYNDNPHHSASKGEIIPNSAGAPLAFESSPMGGIPTTSYPGSGPPDFSYPAPQPSQQPNVMYPTQFNTNDYTIPHNPGTPEVFRGFEQPNMLQQPLSTPMIYADQPYASIPMQTPNPQQQAMTPSMITPTMNTQPPQSAPTTSVPSYLSGISTSNAQPPSYMSGITPPPTNNNSHPYL